MISGGRAINPDALENTPENPSGKGSSIFDCLYDLAG